LGERKKKMKVRKLQSRTAKGVRIGDHESQIVSRLGKPSKIEQSGSSLNQVRVYRYGSSARHGGEAYTFCGGRLIQIQLSAGRDHEEE
jgi:hypothetical protein